LWRGFDETLQTAGYGRPTSSDARRALERAGLRVRRRTIDQSRWLNRAKSVIEVNDQDGTPQFVASYTPNAGGVSYNEGYDNLATSHLLIYLNQRHYGWIPKQMKRFDVQGSGVLPGLVTRRKKDANLWAHGVYSYGY
jgi:GH24 family phage-related lysozyme (muramidase)